MSKPGHRELESKMRSVAKAPANIAFIKYWGKKNERLRIPTNSSISMDLSGAYTTTSVEFKNDLVSDEVYINKERVQNVEFQRVSKHIDLIRDIAKINLPARVISKNNFPKGAGIASSASGFAALTAASVSAAGLNLSEKKISILARLGSGSACRSIPDGFVEWKTGNSSETSFAHSLFPPDYWNIVDIIAVVAETIKKTSSTEGHSLVESSPFFKPRLRNIKNKLKEIKSAMSQRDFTKFGSIIEEEAINMHAVMMTSVPALIYWQPTTIDLIHEMISWRSNGLEAYFTIDAGPNVHVICKSKDAEKIKKRLMKFRGVRKTILNKPSIGARIV
jgi:diphosphomevalonate decarboxylase